MSDIQKRKSRPQKNIHDSFNKDNDAQHDLGALGSGVQVNAWSLLGRAAAIAGVVFAAGFILTVIASSVYDFKDLPHQGEVQFGDNNTQTFFSYYPNLRKFAILDNPSQPGTESQFTKIGTVGTGFFVYSVINTFHWIMEIGFSSLGGMILIPIVVVLVGAAIFFFKMLPQSMQKPDTALTVGIGISMLHAIILVVFFVLALQISPTFKSIFRGPYFYSGDILMTTTRAGVPILLMTGFAYGAIAGGILYLFVYIRAMLLGEKIR